MAYPCDFDESSCALDRRCRTVKVLVKQWDSAAGNSLSPGTRNLRFPMRSYRITSLSCRQCGKSFTVPNCHASKRSCCSKACFDIFRLVPSETRFWAKVEKSEGCWIWTGAKDWDGYGQFNHGRATRFCWELHNGPINPPSLLVCHTCDNPPCVNPAHLFLGTVRDNAVDCSKKGRMPRGSAHCHSKLDEDTVREIRRIIGDGVKSQIALSKELGVSKYAVWAIIHGKSWKHVV